MKKVTVITNSDHDSILAEFNSKLKDEVNILEKELYESKTLVFENISKLDKIEIASCDVFIIEDDINVVLKYLEVLKDAPLVNNIIVTTKPKPTITVFNFLTQKNLLQNISAIFLDFDLAEVPSNHTANQQNAETLYQMIDDKFIHGAFPARLIAVTAYEGTEDKYAALQKSMRENGDYVLNKRILRDEESRADFKTLLKSIPGIYWKEKPKAAKPISGKSVIDNSIAEYERRKPAPKNIDYAKTLLENIEAAMPEISAKTKFEISKQATTITKPNKEEKFSSQQTLAECIEKAALRIDWLIYHPNYKSSFPKFRYQKDNYDIFKTQLTKGMAVKK
jgi:hypothetical protein